MCMIKKSTLSLTFAWEYSSKTSDSRHESTQNYVYSVGHNGTANSKREYDELVEALQNNEGKAFGLFLHEGTNTPLLKFKTPLPENTRLIITEGRDGNDWYSPDRSDIKRIEALLKTSPNIANAMLEKLVFATEPDERFVRASGVEERIDD